MPCKNAIKEYEPGGYYHLYNRGVNKGLIFETDRDYKTFISLLKLYLTPPPPILQGDSLQAEQIHTPPSKHLKNYAGDIELIAYCLMPNHFHLMLKQNSEYGIEHFMRSLITKYAFYFNTKHKRIGHLFQGTYKAVRIINEYQFTYLTKYIHRNPIKLVACKESPCRLEDYPYSSYPNYLNKFSQSWVSCEDILSYFNYTNKHQSYQAFVQDSEPDDITILKETTLDIDYD